MRTIKLIDDRFANPAYALLLVSGLFMVWSAGYPLATLWIAGALVLYLLVLALAFALISPNFRTELRVLETEGPASAAYRAAAVRGRTFGIVGSVMVLAIVFLMVVKPAF
jgi:uncharacterized membrane protein